MSGIAIPITANTMWKASDTPICERAARRSDMNKSYMRGGWCVVVRGARGAAARGCNHSPRTTHLLQFRQPVLDSTIVRELSCHPLQNRPGTVPHAGGDERVGTENPDSEPEEAALGHGREGRQCPQSRSPILLVHDERFD